MKRLTNPVPYTVISRKGNSVTIEYSNITQYKRNTTYLKKFFNESTSGKTAELQTQAVMETNKSGTDKNEQVVSDKGTVQSAPLGGAVAPHRP